jgi:hypothetical protein
MWFFAGFTGKKKPKNVLSWPFLPCFWGEGVGGWPSGCQDFYKQAE